MSHQYKKAADKPMPKHGMIHVQQSNNKYSKQVPQDINKQAVSNTLLSLNRKINN